MLVERLPEASAEARPGVEMKKTMLMLWEPLRIWKSWRTVFVKDLPSALQLTQILSSVSGQHHPKPIVCHQFCIVSSLRTTAQYFSKLFMYQKKREEREDKVFFMIVLYVSDVIFKGIIQYFLKKETPMS